jgi:uncharacterized protein Smg (DUF494 family)
MNDEREQTALRRVLLLISEHLEDFLEGDELALERLGAALEQGDFGGDDLQAAVLALRGLAGERAGGAVLAIDHAPGLWSQRVLSAKERESLSPEAWGYLLDLKRRGSLDAEQFERVLDRLAASGMRPIDVETAHDVAVRIAMPGFEEPCGGESDVAH